MTGKGLLLIPILLSFSGCATYSASWRLPFHATSDQLQDFACGKYGSWSDAKLHNGYCSGRAGLAQVGDEEELTILSDVRRGAKAQWRRFDSAAFKAWLNGYSRRRNKPLERRIDGPH